MPLQPLEELEFGGVDSRSNPLNMPHNRLLRCLNWVPKQAGYLEQRWGYSTVSVVGTVVGSTTGIFPITLWNGTKYILIFQTLPQWRTFTITTPPSEIVPTIRGTPLVSTTVPGNSYSFSNRFYYGDGSNQKFFDGSTWRDNGIRVPTTAEGASVTVSAGANDANGLPVAILSGYQFYAAYYNPVSGQVGNRISIGSRLANTASTVDVSFTGLPQMSTVGGNNSAGDSEWVIVLGRTGDGAQVPYVCVDSGNNWITVPNTATSFTLTSGSIDGNFELPTRNGVIPTAQTMFAVIGDYIYSCDPASPTVRISGSALDARNGRFMGVPEQSWAPDDIETFPTAQPVSCLAEVDLEAFVATQSDCAILTDLAGVRAWRGPWPVGCAGARAKTKTHHGFFWVSGDKELCTFVNGLPMVISEEYEAAELSQIGDQYLSTVELLYFRSAALHKDEIRIEGRKSDGTPYTIIHDFKLTETSSPYGISESSSPYGQGYSAQFLGQLSGPFTSAVVRDVNGKMQVWAMPTGNSNGVLTSLYQHYSGADDAHNQFTSDAISLVNPGPERPSVQFVDWYGDPNVDIAIGKTLKTDLGTDNFAFEELTPSDNPGIVVSGYEDDFRFRATIDRPELHHTYFRIRLTSHSGDGSLALNSPPHVPLESYGRVYALLPIIGDSRGA